MVRVNSEPVCQIRRVQTAPLIHRQGAVIGLLIAAIFVGSIDVALRAYSAIGVHPQTAKVVSPKIQDRLIALVTIRKRRFRRPPRKVQLSPFKPPTPRRPIPEAMLQGCSA